MHSMQYHIVTVVFLVVVVVVDIVASRPDTKFAVFDHVPSVLAVVLPIKVAIIIVNMHVIMHAFIFANCMQEMIAVCHKRFVSYVM